MGEVIRFRRNPTDVKTDRALLDSEVGVNLPTKGSTTPAETDEYFQQTILANKKKQELLKKMREQNNAKTTRNYNLNTNK
jgi:hypothetical protein